MPGAWQQGIQPQPNHLQELLVQDLTPAHLRQNYLLGVNLGAAWAYPHGDAAMQTALNALIGDVQSVLGIRFQRQVVKTDPEPGLVQGADYDLVGERLPYYPAGAGNVFLLLPLPHSHVVSIERVRLFYNTQLLYTVPHDWVLFTSREGILRLNPSLTNAVLQSSQQAGFDSVYYNLVRRSEIPGVWAVDYTVGYGQIDVDVARYICLRAAIQVLALAGAGVDVANGLDSENLSMDGVSESVSHHQGQYGPFSGLIQTYTDELARIDLKGKRAAKKGLKVMIW